MLPPRAGLLVRLLALSLTVAFVAVVATALLATYGAGTRLRHEAETSASLLETDSAIRSSLLTYASDHRDWSDVDALVRRLATETGRRIALTTPGGATIADSANGSGGLPSAPAARIDATRPRDRMLLEKGPDDAGETDFAYEGWQLTPKERAERKALADRAKACLKRRGIEANFHLREEPAASDGGRTLVSTVGSGTSPPQDLRAHPCVPKELGEPSAASKAVKARAATLTASCLRRHGNRERCESEARVAAIRPYVAPEALLYLGSSDRFDPFSSEDWWRTAGTTAVVLLGAALVTVLAGRRLVRPILALTTAAQRMGAGDRTTRVPVTGNDEVTRLATAFNAMAESIERIERQRRDMIGDVAHELRTPLANVRSHLEAVDAGVAPLDSSLVTSLEEESALLEHLVDDLQDLALADAGMLRIHPEERDAADIAAQAVAAHRARAEASGVSVRLDAPESVPVLADPARLRQALGNLVTNAVTHTPEGGVVEVGVRLSGGEAVLTVRDAGPGIAPEHLPHLFDRFYRADRSRSRTTGGSGLGLAITRHIVEAHRGRVEVTSAPGAGSTFTIRLEAGPQDRDMVTIRDSSTEV